jgi:threonine synthase
MKFYSTRDKSKGFSFRDAIIKGLAPDGGLFMPDNIATIDVNRLKDLSLTEMSFEVAKQFLSDALPENILRDIVQRTVNFEVPLVQVDSDSYALELYHGPTLAFKDFGARFLAGLMGYLARDEKQEIVVLAATSGDTGSAVANGFYNVDGVRVIILYPSGKVSPLQEKQLTTLGGNITAWEVQGTFDDCQHLVKQLFMDEELRKKYLLTSANSINIGRLIPQMFYYFYGWAQFCKINKNPFVVSVPSGNFGNLTAGVIAKRMGLPVDTFIASTNVNDVVPKFLSTGEFNPRPSISTISNAMDVGNPSNFERLKYLLGSISAYSFTDDQTREVMRSAYKKYNYVLDPHGAVAYLGLKKYGKPGIFLETAHPGKFHEVVEEALGEKMKLPTALESLKQKEKKSIVVSNNINDVRSLL